MDYPVQKRRPTLQTTLCLALNELPNSLTPNRAHCRPDAVIPVGQHLDAAFAHAFLRTSTSEVGYRPKVIPRAVHPSNETSQGPCATFEQWLALVSSGSTAKEPPRRAVAERPGDAAVNCHSLAVRSSLTADPFQASCHGVLRSFSLREMLLEFKADASRNTEIFGIFRAAVGPAAWPAAATPRRRYQVGDSEHPVLSWAGGLKECPSLHRPTSTRYPRRSPDSPPW